MGLGQGVYFDELKTPCLDEETLCSDEKTLCFDQEHRTLRLVWKNQSARSDRKQILWSDLAESTTTQSPFDLERRSQRD